MQSELRGELRDALVLKKSDHPTQYRPQPHSNSHRSVASDVHERRVEESLVALRSQVELMAKQLVTVTEPQSNPLTAPDTEPQSNPLTAPDQVPQEHEGGDGNAELEGEGGDGNAELDEDGGEVDGEESGGVTGDGGNECERNDEVRPTEQLLDELKVEELLSDDWLKEEVPDGGDGSVSMDEQRREKRDDRVKQTVERLRQHRQGVRIPKWRHVAQGNNDPLDSEVWKRHGTPIHGTNDSSPQVLSLAGVFRASANVVIFVNRTQSAASQTRREDLEENRKVRVGGGSGGSGVVICSQTTESYLSVVLTQAYAWLQQQTKQVLHSVLTDESIRFNFVGVPISTAR